MRIGLHLNSPEPLWNGIYGQMSRSPLPGKVACMGNDQKMSGKAWLVGCGPGTLEHLTLKAVRLIKAADVILYDDLGAEAAVKEFASEAAEQIYVGKRGGQKSIAQPEIDKLLVSYCRQGKQVVRLKGGCPSVFSRCSSELHALAAAGFAAELVPGVSSALAAPLFAGFPLTDVQLGRSFAVTSGHQPEATDWTAFLGVDTLVVLMAGKNLNVLMQLLLSAGWAPDRAVAIVRAAGQPDQQIWKGFVSTIVQQTKGAGQLSPCVLIIGEVVSLAGAS